MTPPGGPTVGRDAYGIPSVGVDTEELAWSGLGRAAAEDRLWQPEYDRRRSRRRWDEVVGPSALPADRPARRLRSADAAERDVTAMDAVTRMTFECYAEGVQGGAYGWAEGTPFNIPNRQVLDLGALDRSGWGIPGGASGRAGDPHAFDRPEAWTRHRLVPMRPSWAVDA